MKNVQLADDVELARKQTKNKGKRGYNFVGKEFEWTSSEEQKIKANEIEKVTKNN